MIHFYPSRCVAVCCTLTSTANFGIQPTVLQLLLMFSVVTSKIMALSPKNAQSLMHQHSFIAMHLLLNVVAQQLFPPNYPVTSSLNSWHIAQTIPSNDSSEILLIADWLQKIQALADILIAQLICQMQV